MDKQINLDRSRDISCPVDKLNPDELMKQESHYLRGSIIESLLDSITGAVSEIDAKLMKFHGIYQQDDRDIRDERRHQKLEPAYMFMVRVRLPGGVCSSKQLLQLMNIAEYYANGTLRITTRQTFQLHEVLKHNLKAVIQSLHNVGLDTVAACGDDTRGVMCAVNPRQSGLHNEVYTLARQISDRFIPKTGAYQEVWFDKKTEVLENEEPLYGPTYLPRKFKIGIVVPPVNDIDIYAQDLGFIAIHENDRLIGFNICVGGGMGHTDNVSSTYPRLADVIGYIGKDKIFDVVKATICIQRDFGDRVDRAQARFKYTIDNKGMNWFKKELEQRTGFLLEKQRQMEFYTNGDQLGWQEGKDNQHHVTLFIENGRIKDKENLGLMSGLHELVSIHHGEFRLTPNQNIMLANIENKKKKQIENILDKYELNNGLKQSRVRQHSIACVAFPTCGLAMAESERYLPGLITKIESILTTHNLINEAITIRMSGCPNGCSRPFISEIGLTGRALGKYNLYLGGTHNGTRLNRLFKENINEAQILKELEIIIKHYADDRLPDESFGDFVIREGYVKAVTSGVDFKNNSNGEGH
ncbi:MAG: NADPH-dependent assimilatory sulfite reductase hemoprotein subunit [Proteobacteria bacterium]|nr:NADPH-dependent assimilatory sulfite reductase hemoprotein subunit [Pseudomonadota bacterium]NOG59931.1 NADPH-dependent assimilatory sulfite reductase hemoprotein subunit [Pseudomonadota bacterium]